MAFTDLKQLRKIMQDEEIAVFSSVFTYNKVNCYIAYCLLTSDDKEREKYKYAILRTRFIKKDNFDEYINCPANSNGINVRYGELRRFFNIKYDNSGTDEWYNALIESIGNAIKPFIPMQTNELINASIDTVCRHEHRDPNRIYRHHLMRHFVDDNGNGKCRTEYNAQLAALRFPKLYDIYRKDKHVSFVFTDNEAEEVSEQEAYNNFIYLENHRKPKSQ